MTLMLPQYRFTPNAHAASAGMHTVNENADIRAHAQAARFMHAFVRNTDKA